MGALLFWLVILIVLMGGAGFLWSLLLDMLLWIGLPALLIAYFAPIWDKHRD